MDLSNKDATGCGSDSSNDGYDLASPSFYELDRSAMSISPMETEDGPAVSASPIPPLPASPEQQAMDLTVGDGRPARTPARTPTRTTAMVDPPPMGAAGRSATPARQTGSGLGAIRHRRHSTVGTSTAAGGQLRRSGRTGRETVMPQLDDMAAAEWKDARSGLFSPRPVRSTLLPAAADQQAKAACDNESIARKQRQADESSPAPTPTSPFLSAGVACCMRRYAWRSSPVFGPSGRGPAWVRARCGSERAARFSVDGTISDGRCRKARRYSIPSLVRYQ
uniref:Uncharacterized protein n=1 Tax=Anopheles melas TaxID=34690 RepID=A0A182UGI0_9DIPT